MLGIWNLPNKHKSTCVCLAHTEVTEMANENRVLKFWVVIDFIILYMMKSFDPRDRK